MASINFGQVVSSFDPKELLSIRDAQGKTIILLKNNGEVVLDDSVTVDDAALEFWKGVTNFMPVDKKEIYQNKIMLIEAFSTIRDIFVQNKMEFKDQETELKFNDLYDRLYSYFMTSYI